MNGPLWGEWMVPGCISDSRFSNPKQTFFFLKFPTHKTAKRSWIIDEGTIFKVVIYNIEIVFEV